MLRHAGVPVHAGLRGWGLRTVPSAAAGPGTTGRGPAELGSVEKGLCHPAFSSAGEILKPGFHPKDPLDSGEGKRRRKARCAPLWEVHPAPPTWDNIPPGAKLSLRHLQAQKPRGEAGVKPNAWWTNPPLAAAVPAPCITGASRVHVSRGPAPCCCDPPLPTSYAR